MKLLLSLAAVDRQGQEKGIIIIEQKANQVSSNLSCLLWDQQSWIDKSQAAPLEVWLYIQCQAMTDHEALILNGAVSAAETTLLELWLLIDSPSYAVVAAAAVIVDWAQRQGQIFANNNFLVEGNHAHQLLCMSFQEVWIQERRHSLEHFLFFDA